MRDQHSSHKYNITTTTKMSENLINQYGRTELSLCSEYIKNIFTHAELGFFFFFFIRQDQTKKEL